MGRAISHTVSIGSMALKSFRFALGSSARPASGIWRVWVQEDDVHLQIHGTHQIVEFTAYRTGRWRIASGAAVSRWTRPKDFRPGWTEGPDLLIPGSHHPLRLPDPFPPGSEPVVWYPAPAPGRLARFKVLFASTRSSQYPWQPTDVAGTAGITILALRTAGWLHICRRDEPDEDLPDPLAAEATATLAVTVSANQAGVPSLRESYGNT